MKDLDIIKQIEKELNVKLKKLVKIEWGSKGYTLNQNVQVTGLCLRNYNIENLNRIISSLKALENLKELDLSNNQISDISPLKDLKNLTELFLNHNQLADISPLKDLKNLTELQLMENQLNDITSLKDLKKLEELWLSTNQLRDISPLNKLVNLVELSLGINQIYDISPLEKLKNLRKVWLCSNPIEELPSWITDFEMNIRWDSGIAPEDSCIVINDAPLKSPPPEIVEQGKDAVRNYFEQIETQGKDNILKRN